MENRFYVYLLLDSRKLYLPFYVGKGTGKRAYEHFRPAALKKIHPRNSVVKAIRAAGKEPRVFIWEDNLSEADALELEVSLIQRFGRKNIHPDGLLTNMTDGGQLDAGRIFTDEHKQKIGNANRGQIRSEQTREAIAEARRGTTASIETRQKLSDAHKGRGFGENNPMFGKTHSEEFKKFLSEKNKGELNPNFGKKHSEETKEIIRQINTGRKLSPDAIAKSRWTGKSHSEETKAKMRASAVLREKRKKETR